MQTSLKVLEKLEVDDIMWDASLRPRQLNMNVSVLAQERKSAIFFWFMYLRNTKVDVYLRRSYALTLTLASNFVTCFLMKVALVEDEHQLYETGLINRASSVLSDILLTHFVSSSVGLRMEHPFFFQTLITIGLIQKFILSFLATNLGLDQIRNNLSPRKGTKFFHSSCGKAYQEKSLQK